MDAFIQKFCEKYSLPIALSLQLLDNMEKFTFHKGDFLVQEGGRNSNFYICLLYTSPSPRDRG